MNNTTDKTSVWYQEPWVWFIILLMSAAITACIWTIVIAVSGADQMVSDDYYKDGLMINKNLALDKKAHALNLSAKLEINKKQVRVMLSEPMHDDLLLQFSHPIEKSLDFFITLKHQSNKVFTAELPNEINHRWYVTLTNHSNEWRLKSVLNIKPSKKKITSNLLPSQ